MVRPRLLTPVFTARRILFNEMLRWRTFSCDATVGFDADGYAIARTRSPSHIACIKGVLGDAVRFEKGATRASMALQAHLEGMHARRAHRVVTISRYCAERLQELYGVQNAAIVPELIDLDRWQELFRRNPAPSHQGKFTVLTVCRFYPRKRADVLLRAAATLRHRIPELEIRIIGGGPEFGRLQEIGQRLQLGSVIRWLGDASVNELAREYNHADIFCLASVQEGFGLVFLEAMAAGKPIVAARAAAIPEVARHGVLVEPDNPEALADGILRLYCDSSLRRELSARGLQDVQQYEMRNIAAQFLSVVAGGAS